MKARSEKEGDQAHYQKALREGQDYLLELQKSEEGGQLKIGNANFGRTTSQSFHQRRRHVMALSFNGRQENTLFHNRGNGKFVEVGGVLGVGFEADGRGLASADLDRDGAPDFVLRNAYQPALQVLRNRLGGTSLTIRLRGTKSNSFGVGALVRVGSQARELTCGGSFLSCNPMELHFGLADADQAKVTVLWPSGKKTELSNVPAGIVTIHEDREEFDHVPCSKTTASKPSPPARPLRAGDTVDFELTSFDSKTLRADSWKKGWTVVNLWSAFCESCAAESRAYPALIDAARKRNVRFVSINVDEDSPMVREIVAQIQHPVPVWIGSKIEDRLLNPHEPIVPATLLVDPKGRVASRHVGTLTPEELNAFLDRAGVK